MNEPINFDRADYVEVSALQCKLCRESLQHEYYDLGGSPICTYCRGKIDEGRSPGAGSQRLFRAAGFGLAAATLGAAGYASIVNLTGIEFGFMAIILGYVVGRSVSVGSYHWGGALYQAIAMALTYVAICVEYVPAILNSVKGHHSVSLIITAFVISLAAPFLILFDRGLSGILGLFIIAIGLYEAWKLNKRGVREVAGPYPIAPPKERSPIVAS
ncbi:MAG: hypothetical protein ABJF23_07875 [Bryobacteraceae bacterium]